MSPVTPPRTLFITGYAKLPSGITAAELYKVVGLGVEVEADTGKIVAAECTLATAVGRSFVARLVVGRNLYLGVNDIVRAIESAYYGSAQKAIVTALRICHEKYRSYRERAGSDVHPSEGDETT